MLIDPALPLKHLQSCLTNVFVERVVEPFTFSNNHLNIPPLLCVTQVASFAVFQQERHGGFLLRVFGQFRHRTNHRPEIIVAPNLVREDASLQMLVMSTLLLDGRLSDTQIHRAVRNIVAVIGRVVRQQRWGVGLPLLLQPRHETREFPSRVLFDDALDDLCRCLVQFCFHVSPFGAWLTNTHTRCAFPRSPTRRTRERTFSDGIRLFQKALQNL